MSESTIASAPKAKASAKAKVLPAVVTLMFSDMKGLEAAHKAAEGLKGEEFRLHLVSVADTLQSLAPVKVVFSSDAAKRKEQMQAFATAKGEHQKLCRANHQWLNANGQGEASIRYSGSVSTSGIVTSRQVEAVKVRPPKGSAIRY